MSSHQEEVIRRIQQQSGGAERARRIHYVKMGIAGGATVLCFVLFATGVLGQGRTDRSQVRASSGGGAAAVASVSGPELGALAAGGAAAVWLMALVLGLRKLE